MIRHDMEQGSPAWYKVRAGIPTSSNFGKLVTPGGKPSKSMDAYVNRCIADLVVGESPAEPVSTDWMERGTMMEAEAADWYEFERGLELQKVGFITDDGGRWGCSPDRLVVQDGVEIGALEIKCPAPWTHIENVLRGTIKREYIPQVQGQMLIGGFAWVDWLTYHPMLGGFVVRIERDNDYIAVLAEALEQFDTQKQEKLARLREMNIIYDMPEGELGGI